MTFQQQLEADRESTREQLAAATKPNTLRIGYGGGVVGAMARDNAERIVLVNLDRAALRQLAADIAEAERCLSAHATDDDTPAPTERNPRIDGIRGRE